MDPYTTRRLALARTMGTDSVAILPAGHETLRTGDSTYRFRPDSDFYYLTGETIPDAILVVSPGHADHDTALFVPPKDPAREIWCGPQRDYDQIKADTGVDAVFSVEDFDSKLEGLLTGMRRVYYQVGVWTDLEQRLTQQIRRLRKTKRYRVTTPTEIVDPGVILHALRLIKDENELTLLRRASEITCDAHRLAMSVTRPGMNERELEALVDYVFRRSGGEGPGYPTIVAGGKNATTLHYIANDTVLEDGDLVLIDAGCEFGFYTADVTRTFPVSGRFTDTQREVYEIVLAAQQAAIRAVSPGTPIDAVHDAALRVLTQGLADLGVLEGDTRVLLDSGAYRAYYMHRTSHWLGMEVHDVGEYRDGETPRKLEPGMVLTVEPGLYFRPDLEEVPVDLRGIGIRIEDDILVTQSGHEVLTRAVPKDVETLEAIVGTATSPLTAGL